MPRHTVPAVFFPSFCLPLLLSNLRHTIAGFMPGDLLDKPWSLVSPLLPLGIIPRIAFFTRRIEHSAFPFLLGFHRILDVANSTLSRFLQMHSCFKYDNSTNIPQFCYFWLGELVCIFPPSRIFVAHRVQHSHCSSTFTNARSSASYAAGIRAV